LLQPEVVKEIKAAVESLAKFAGEHIPPDVQTVFDVLPDPKTPASVEGTVTESTELEFEAKLAVPAVATQGMPARTVTVRLEATDVASGFDLIVDWGQGRIVFDVNARRDEKGTIVVSTKIKDKKIEVR